MANESASMSRPCPRCGYSTESIMNDRCPECGLRLAQAFRRVDRLGEARRRGRRGWRVYVIEVIVLGVSCVGTSLVALANSPFALVSVVFFLGPALLMGVTYVPWRMLARSTRALDDAVNLWFLGWWPWLCAGAVLAWAVAVALMMVR